MVNLIWRFDLRLKPQLPKKYRLLANKARKIIILLRSPKLSPNPWYTHYLHSFSEQISERPNLVRFIWTLLYFFDHSFWNWFGLPAADVMKEEIIKLLAFFPSPLSQSYKTEDTVKLQKIWHFCNKLECLQVSISQTF